MNISYVTLYDALDIHKWSGCGYYFAKTLENQGAELDYISNFKIHQSKVHNFKKLYYKMLGKKFLITRTPFYAEQVARQADQLIKPNSQIIFSPGSIAISLMESKVPKVFYTDACFAGILNFYESFTNLSEESIRHGHYLEQRALDSSKLIIYSSDWAAKTAIDNYHVDPAKVKVVPFGANIESTRNFNDIKNIVASRSKTKCNLLFIGVDWIRKGGELALKVAQELNNRGIDTTLHIVGIKNLDTKLLPPFAVNHGFISKSTSEGSDRLDELFTSCHFLIVPSRAEAFGLVFAEASSFGMPSLATNVGGIPAAITDNVNGKTFPLLSSETVYADFIMDHFSDSHKYTQLAYSSFNEFETRLNWNVSGVKIKKLIQEIL